MYLPGPEQSDTSDGPRLTERSSPTPDTEGLAENIDLTESASLPDEDDELKSMKRRRLQRNEGEKSRLLEPALVRALVSIAENQEDAFQRVCLETLAELCKFQGMLPAVLVHSPYLPAHLPAQAFSISVHYSTVMRSGYYCKQSNKGHMTCPAP